MNPGTTCIFYQVCCGDNGFALKGVKFSENRPPNRSINKKEKKTPCQKVGLFCYFSALSCNFYCRNCYFIKFSFLMCYIFINVLHLPQKQVLWNLYN